MAPESILEFEGGLDDAGNLVVIEVWDTPEPHARFMEGRVADALAKGGID